MNDLQKTLFEQNKAAALGAMEDARKRLGAQRMTVVVSYDGGGDEGGVTGVEVGASGPNHDHLDVRSIEPLTVPFATFESIWRDGAYHHGDPTIADRDFDSAVSDLAEDAIIMMGHGGYQNNEGGNGEFVLCVSEGSEPEVNLTHRDVIEAYNTTEHTL